FLFQLVRADFYNPVSQFVVQASNPPLRYLRRFIPGLGGVDVAALVLMLALKVLERWIVLGMQGVAAGPVALGLLATADLLDLAISVFMVSILVQVVLSWVAPATYNPVVGLVRDLNEPLTGPARRLMPAVAGWDLSPILILIVLQLASMLVVAPVRDLGRAFL
ncbi:MAG: YggT family protein, partial [Gammaproteobacteria bacterium]|nr:YggT family protein [Gammaproteobacteria bacterium]